MVLSMSCHFAHENTAFFPYLLFHASCFMYYFLPHTSNDIKNSITKKNCWVSEPTWLVICCLSQDIKSFSHKFLSAFLSFVALHCKSSYINAIYWRGNWLKWPLTIFYGRSDKIQSCFKDCMYLWGKMLTILSMLCPCYLKLIFWRFF